MTELKLAFQMQGVPHPWFLDFYSQRYQVCHHSRYQQPLESFHDNRSTVVKSVMLAVLRSIIDKMRVTLPVSMALFFISGVSLLSFSKSSFTSILTSLCLLSLLHHADSAFPFRKLQSQSFVIFAYLGASQTHPPFVICNHHSLPRTYPSS